MYGLCQRVSLSFADTLLSVCMVCASALFSVLLTRFSFQKVHVPFWERFPTLKFKRIHEFLCQRVILGFADTLFSVAMVHEFLLQDPIMQKVHEFLLHDPIMQNFGKGAH